MGNRLKAFLIIIVFLAFGAVVLASDFFCIKKINVLGNKEVNKNDIIRLSGLHYGQNVFRMNKKRIIRDVFTNPKIRAVRIKRILPSSVNIDIIEREPIAMIPYLGSFLNIDNEAMIIEIDSNEQSKKIPQIISFNFNDFKIGEVLKIENNQQLEIALEISNALKEQDLLKEIKVIDLEDLNNILLKTRTGIQVYLCDNNIDYRIKLLRSIIEDLLKNDEMGIIDMRHDGNPIFKRIEAGSEENEG